MQKKSSEKYQSLFKEEKGKKINNMDVNDIKISLKMKSKGYLSTENDTMNCEKKITSWPDMRKYKKLIFFGI